MGNFKIYKVVLLLVIILIIGSIISIILIDKKTTSPSDSKLTINKELAPLDSSINNLKLSPLRGKGRIDEYLNSLAAANSESDKIKYADALFTEIVFIYSETNDQNAPKTLDLIKSYLSKNFPKYYSENKDNYNYPCIDESCADSPQPKEILNIVEEVKKSDFPVELKTTLIMDLINTGYRSKNENDTKANQYYLLAQDLKNNTDASKTKQNIIIGDKIMNFIKSTFPKEYSQLSK